MCLGTVFKSVGELSSILSGKCLDKPCRGTVLSGNCLVPFVTSELPCYSPQGLETYFNMHKYTELLTFLTKIRISEYKHIQGIELHGGQFAYRPCSNHFSQSF